MKYSRLLSGLIFFLLGVFTLLEYYSPGSGGRFGQYYSTEILWPLFGKTSTFLGLFFILCSMILLKGQKIGKSIIGLLLVLIPSALIIFSPFKNYHIENNALLVKELDFFLTDNFGSGGRYLIAISLLCIGLYLLYRVYLRGQFIRPGILDPIIPPSQAIKSEEIVDEEKTDLEDTDADEVIMPLLDLKDRSKKFATPLITLLDIEKGGDKIDTKENAARIENAFSEFGLSVKVGEASVGPTFMQYRLQPASKTKISKIRGLEEDVSLAIGSKSSIYTNRDNELVIDVSLKQRSPVLFRRLLEEGLTGKANIPIFLGVDVSQKVIVNDLTSMPHLLIAGTTGSGKSILLKTILASIFYNCTPANVKLTLIDPKRIEFGPFKESPFLASKPIIELEETIQVLNEAVIEMENRYKIFEQVGVTNITTYNDSNYIEEKLPYLCIIIDEFSDLVMMGKDSISDPLIRLAQKARACGIHLIIATQRPSADIINGLIKANFPAKIALSVSSGINSKIILDRTGAEKLLGKGDMIVMSSEYPEGIRVQGALITDPEVNKINNFIHKWNYAD